MKFNFSFIIIFTLLAALLTGCGGSSGSGSSGFGAGKVAVYATDSLGSNDHVWVTIKKITANSGSGSQTLFDEPTGKVVDLASLRDSSGKKFGFLSMATLTSQDSSSATVTFAKDLTLVPTGSTTGVPKQFADQFDNVSGDSVVTFGFKNSRKLGQGDPILVIDFDLAKWNEVAGKIVPVISESDESGLEDSDRHIEEDVHGTVGALAGISPNFTFSLTLRSGTKIQVQTDSNTAFLNRSGAANPALANGKKVEVHGKVSATSGVLAATIVKIEDEGDHHGAEVKGAVTNIEATAGTFDIAASEVSGFVPGAAVIHVSTDSNTIFRSHNGVVMTKDEFFTALATANFAEVEGVYDSGTNTMLAAKLRIEDSGSGGGGGGGGDHHEAEAKGSTTELNADAGTFKLTLTSWEGFASQAGAVVDVTTNGTTVFKDKTGTVITKQAFFDAIASTGHAEVKGDFSSGTITAVRCKVED